MAFLRLYYYFTVALIVYLCQPGSSLFSWHPTFMTIAGMLIINEGTSLFVPKYGMLDGASRTTKINVHVVLQLIGFTILFIGFSCAAMHKNNLGKDHFTTPHAIMGALTGVLGGFQIFGGIIARFTILAPAPLEYLRLGHTLNGMAFYFVLCLTFMGGIFSDFMTARTTPFIQIIFISLPIIVFARSFSPTLNRFLRVMLKPK